LSAPPRKLHPKRWSPRRLRWVLNLYPPFLLQRIVVRSVSDDYRDVVVRVRRSPLNFNLAGTTFGGSLYSAADPLHALMYWQSFAQAGQRVEAWTRGAEIRFRRPANRHVDLHFHLEPEDLERARAALEQTGRFDATHPVRALDPDGEVCVEFQVAVTLKRPRG
jgi:acyl-coenzyme A thioesterase PaaI-like protein